MASDSQHNSASPKRSRLPFEPNKSNHRSGSSPPKHTSVTETTGIPEVVSRRMARRMALFCGVPTLLGFLTFPSGYLIISRGWLDLPNIAVMLASIGLFGLGALGLSYGVLSASWDDQSGSKLGWQEFRVNLGRVIQEWRSQREQKKS